MMNLSASDERNLPKIAESSDHNKSGDVSKPVVATTQDIQTQEDTERDHPESSAAREKYWAKP